MTPTVGGFLGALWRSARRPEVFRRCALIALVVGSLLTLVNQWELLTLADLNRVPWLRVLANYAVPFVVSNLGAASAARSD